VPLDRLVELLPLVVKVIGFLLLVYVVADFLLLLGLLPGQPIEQNGQFFFNNHGSLTPISLERYRQGLAYQARLFTGHEMVFYGVATLVAYQLDRFRRGQISPTTPAIPTLSEFARAGPMSRLVVLETALIPDQCVSRIHASRLSGSASPDGFWLALERGARASLVFATGRFTPQGTGTRVEVRLELKRWGWWSLIASAALVPVFGVAIDWATGGGDLAAIVFVLVAFILIGNVTALWLERRRLLSAIESALSARQH
jgi:hypothetical protein